MKHLTIKTTLLTASLFGVVGLASAHDQAGTLGATKSAIDYYQIQCFDDGNGPAEHLELSVIDPAGPKAAPVISAQVTKGILAMNTADIVDGDALYSPAVKLNGGNGSYYVMVDKTNKAADNYSLEYHCETATKAHTGTNITILQNK